MHPHDIGLHIRKGLISWGLIFSSRNFFLGWELDSRSHYFNLHTSFPRHSRWKHLFISITFSLCWETVEDLPPPPDNNYHKSRGLITRGLKSNSMMTIIRDGFLWWLLSGECISICQSNEKLIEMGECSHQPWRQNNVQSAAKLFEHLR